MNNINEMNTRNATIKVIKIKDNDIINLKRLHIKKIIIIIYVFKKDSNDNTLSKHRNLRKTLSYINNTYTKYSLDRTIS